MARGLVLPAHTAAISRQLSRCPSSVRRTAHQLVGSVAQRRHGCWTSFAGAGAVLSGQPYRKLRISLTVSTQLNHRGRQPACICRKVLAGPVPILSVFPALIMLFSTCLFVYNARNSLFRCSNSTKILHFGAQAISLERMKFKFGLQIERKEYCYYTCYSSAAWGAFRVTWPLKILGNMC